MQQPAKSKDGIFFTIALSELTNSLVHGYLKPSKTDDVLNWDLTTTFCCLTDEKVISINGVTSKEELESNHKGMIKLTATNGKHLLEFVNDPQLEKNANVLVDNYKKAILDTYGQNLIGTIINSRSNDDSNSSKDF